MPMNDDLAQRRARATSIKVKRHPKWRSRTMLGASLQRGRDLAEELPVLRGNDMV
jgi:hypothetical protein